MELNIKLTIEECYCLKGLIELALRQDFIYGADQVLASIQRKVLFEMSKIQCPYCESHVFVEEQAEKVRKCLECGNEFECG
jgi:DNA-directed RNA polymerase subunit RPC12/RpoP